MQSLFPPAEGQVHRSSEASEVEEEDEDEGVGQGIPLSISECNCPVNLFFWHHLS